jgi:bifunctional non-homologous end joining protein LigD
MPATGKTGVAPDNVPEHYNRAIDLIRRVCGVAGSLTFLDAILIDVQKAGILEAVAKRKLIVQREGKRVRLFTRNGHDWTDRYPLIVEAALKNRSSSFVIDGEAVLLGVDGVSDFDGLHTGKHDAEVQLYAFDCLALDGDDRRKLPLSLRKTNLARLLARRPDGIFLAPFEQGEIGPDLFRKACEFGLEGLVSKHRDRSYRAGTSPNWLKVKNPKHPAMQRVKEAFDAKARNRGPINLRG